jgi:hypothetical protein
VPAAGLMMLKTLLMLSFPSVNQQQKARQFAGLFHLR